MFFSPPFSCSASLCEQLLAGGSGETPAYSLLFKLNFLWIYVVLTLIQTRMPIGRNAVWIYAVLTLIQTLVPNKSFHINVFRLFAIIEKSQ